MTVPNRILLQVAVLATLTVALARLLTYNKVYDDVLQRDLKHLETYVIERARREEVGFLQVRINLALVRGQFLKRLETPAPDDLDAQWDRRFRLFADGSWRSREEFANGRIHSTLWAHRDTEFTPELKHEVICAQDLCDELLTGWADVFPSVYFVMPGWLNIGFDPRLASWVWETPADYDPGDLEWFQLAMPKDPQEDDFVWTGVIEEPTTKVPIVSTYLPIWKDGHFLGSVGHDLFVNRLMEETTQSGLTGAKHVIFRADGRLIAHPDMRREILDSKGTLRMQDCGAPELASIYRLVSAQPDRIVSGFDEESRLYYTAARLSGPEWIFLTTMPRDVLAHQASQAVRWVLWSGLIALTLGLGVLAVVLRRQIARPLAELSRATKQMATLDTSARATVHRDDEFGALAHAFNDMAERIAARGNELRQLNQDLEKRVGQRTAELTEANRRLDQAREEALGLLARERELRELKSNFVSLVSHEFRTPLEVIMSSADNLIRYHDRLAPEKREHLLRTINKSVRQMSGMMEEVLVLGRLEADGMVFKPATVDLPAFCQRIRDEIASATNSRCPIHLDCESVSGAARADESLLHHIFTNLLSNAVKYSPAGSPVEFIVRRERDEAVCRIRDRGCGIPEADQKLLFQAFQRGSNVQQIPGTGLGLLIVQRCVELHNGTVSFESVEGRGTTFSVRLPLFASAGPGDEACDPSV